MCAALGGEPVLEGANEVRVPLRSHQSRLEEVAQGVVTETPNRESLRPYKRKAPSGGTLSIASTKRKLDPHCTLHPSRPVTSLVKCEEAEVPRKPKLKLTRKLKPTHKPRSKRESEETVSSLMALLGLPLPPKGEVVGKDADQVLHCLQVAAKAAVVGNASYLIPHISYLMSRNFF